MYCRNMGLVMPTQYYQAVMKKREAGFRVICLSKKVQTCDPYYSTKVFIQHRRAIQPHTTTSRAPIEPQTVCTDHHCAWEKQLAKPDHSSLTDFDCKK